MLRVNHMTGMKQRGVRTSNGAACRFLQSSVLRRHLDPQYSAIKIEMGIGPAVVAINCPCMHGMIYVSHIDLFVRIRILVFFYR